MNMSRMVVEKFIKGLLTAGAVLGGASALLATINAICRKFLSISFPWAEELCTYMVVVAFFFAMPYLELTNSQLSIGVLDDMIKNKFAKKVMFVVKGIIVVVLSIVLVRYGIAATAAAHASSTLTYVLKWPRAIFFGITVASFILTILAWISIYLLNKGEKFDD